MRAALRPSYLRLTRTSPTRHERSFLEYQLALPSILRSERIPFTVVAAAEIMATRTSNLRELTLTTSRPVAEVGDMLYLLWRNSPEVVLASLPPRTHSREVGYWTTPAPGIPPVRARASVNTLLSEVLDLSERPSGQGFDALLRHTGRITPRSYTLSGVRPLPSGGQELRILVSHHSDWPSRSAAYLHRAQPGEVLQGWVLPHPHRIPSLHGWGNEGLAVVTGSGIAGVLAALRAGIAGNPWIVWGFRGPLSAALSEEFDAFIAHGAIRRLDIADSRSDHGPRRVNDILDSSADALQETLDAGHWLYVSGHASSAAPIRTAFTRAASPEAVSQMQDELRFIQST